MRIVFIVIGNSRRSNYLNGTNLRYGNGGGSGTDTSSVLMAEYLAKQGHEVVFVADKLEQLLQEKYTQEGRNYTPGESHYGVQYTNLDFDGIDNREFDILISMLWFHQYDILPITVTKAVIYWSHMQWIYGIDEIANYARDNNLAVGFVHISEWEKSMTKEVVKRAERDNLKVVSALIPNPLVDDMILEAKKNCKGKKKHKVIFHAAWARGGNVAVDALRKMDWEDKEFHAFDYLMATHAHEDSFFNMHNGVDKATLFKHLAESEYFIYPLYTPYKDVHKDTFSCVVAEAIALDCIVLTYPLGALPENFDGFCYWLPAPQGVDFAKMNAEPLSRDEEGIFKTTEGIVAALNQLELDQSYKDILRNRATETMITNFGVEPIGQKWTTFINKLINE